MAASAIENYQSFFERISGGWHISEEDAFLRRRERGSTQGGSRANRRLPRAVG